jgi:GrpB-like predicted nucleotidyltransferase (UPF0157 family)
MDEILLVEYDLRWPEMYKAEAERVQSVLPAGLVRAVEHFGSTAIPGLVAKPIIDILVAVRSVQEAHEVAVSTMESLGYAFWADNPKRDCLFFVKGLPPHARQRTHHVHMAELNGEIWEQLLFRDYLRIHPEEASRYGALKLELMERYRDDREAYTDAKSAYIQEIMSLARSSA